MVLSLHVFAAYYVQDAPSQKITSGIQNPSTFALFKARLKLDIGGQAATLDIWHKAELLKGGRGLFLSSRCRTSVKSTNLNSTRCDGIKATVNNSIKSYKGRRELADENVGNLTTAEVLNTVRRERSSQNSV